MVTVCAELTAAATMLNVADVAPAATFTVAGTLTAEELEDNVTEAPPAGAAAVNRTLP